MGGHVEAKRRAGAVLALIAALAVSCAPGKAGATDAVVAKAEIWRPDGEAMKLADRLRANGGLRVASTETAGIYEPKPDGTFSGFMMLLAAEFADRLGVPLVKETVEFDEFFAVGGKVPRTGAPAGTVPDIYGRTDLLVHSITPLPWRENLMRFVKILPSRVMTVSRKGEQVSAVAGLAGKRVMVMRTTSYETIADDISGRLGIPIDIIRVPFGYDVIRGIAEGEADVTFRDANVLAQAIMARTDLSVGASVSDLQTLGWSVRPGDEQLGSTLDEFIAASKKDGTFDRIWSSSSSMTYDEYKSLVRYREPMMPALDAAQEARLLELRATGLRVAIDQDMTVYEAREPLTPTGHHYNLVRRFAETFDLPLRLRLVRFNDFWTVNGKIPDRAKTDPAFPWKPDLIGKVDLYVAPLSPLEWRKKFLRFQSLFPTTLVWLTNSDRSVSSIRDLDGKRISVLENSSYEIWLAEQARANRVAIEYVFDPTARGTIEMVKTGKVDATISDGSIALVWIRDFPGLSMYPASKEIDDLSWGMAKDDVALSGILAAWIASIKQDGTFEDIWLDYYGSSLAEYLGVMGR